MNKLIQTINKFRFKLSNFISFLGDIDVSFITAIGHLENIVERLKNQVFNVFGISKISTIENSINNQDNNFSGIQSQFNYHSGVYTNLNVKNKLKDFELFYLDYGTKTIHGTDYIYRILPDWENGNFSYFESLNVPVNDLDYRSFLEFLFVLSANEVAGISEFPFRRIKTNYPFQYISFEEDPINDKLLYDQNISGLTDIPAIPFQDSSAWNLITSGINDMQNTPRLIFVNYQKSSEFKFDTGNNPNNYIQTFNGDFSSILNRKFSIDYDSFNNFGIFKGNVDLSSITQNSSGTAHNVYDFCIVFEPFNSFSYSFIGSNVTITYYSVTGTFHYHHFSKNILFLPIEFIDLNNVDKLKHIEFYISYSFYHLVNAGSPGVITGQKVYKGMLFDADLELVPVFLKNNNTDVIIDTGVNIGNNIINGVFQNTFKCNIKYDSEGIGFDNYDELIVPWAVDKSKWVGGTIIEGILFDRWITSGNLRNLILSNNIIGIAFIPFLKKISVTPSYLRSIDYNNNLEIIKPIKSVLLLSLNIIPSIEISLFNLHSYSSDDIRYKLIPSRIQE